MKSPTNRREDFEEIAHQTQDVLCMKFEEIAQHSFA
jgi:hypothetical protein